MRAASTTVLLVLLMGTAIGLQAMRERAGAIGPGGDGVLYVQSPAAVRRMALSYHSLLADVYWIRAVQHYGDTKLGRTTSRTYGQLYPLLDLATSLDPFFNVAYQFGALFLAEAPPGGPGRPDLALALLEKGIAAQPENWQLYQAAGFVHYWSREDYSTAAGWFQKAARLPGAPRWMDALAAVTLAEGGNRQASRLMWQEIRRSATDDWFQREATRRLGQLDALDQLDVLTQAVATFQAREARPPADWAELARGGYIRGAPVDPTGVPYRLEGGRVALAPESRLLPLPRGAAQP
jgi:tetratricopeptide (TPR) repeat protein